MPSIKPLVTPATQTARIAAPRAPPISAPRSPGGFEDWQVAYLKPAPLSPQHPTPVIEWKTLELPIEIPTAKSGLRPTVHLEGDFLESGSTLMREGRVLVTVPSGGRKGGFTMDLFLVSEVTQIELVYVNAHGTVSKERITVACRGWEKLQAHLRSLRDKIVNSTPLSFSLGLSYTAYQETLFPDFSQVAVSAKISYLRRYMSSNWDWAASGYITLIPLYANQSGNVLRFVGLNARFGYVLPQIREPWRFSVLGGAYYTTTFSSGESFGFQNMFGPQIFPTLRRTLNPQDSMGAYFKFSPILSGATPSFDSRELAFGVNFTRMLKNGHPFSVSADMSSLNLKILTDILDENNQPRTLTIKTTSLTLSAGYSF